MDTTQANVNALFHRSTASTATANATEPISINIEELADIVPDATDATGSVETPGAAAVAPPDEAKAPGAEVDEVAAGQPQQPVAEAKEPPVAAEPPVAVQPEVAAAEAAAEAAAAAAAAPTPTPATKRVSLTLVVPRAAKRLRTGTGAFFPAAAVDPEPCAARVPTGSLCLRPIVEVVQPMSLGRPPTGYIKRRRILRHQPTVLYVLWHDSLPLHLL